MTATRLELKFTPAKADDVGRQDQAANGNSGL
jgi:hypothetical protein